MASTQQLKSRIKSVKSTKQITKAMELVAASRMRKAQDATTASRAYASAAREILTRLNELSDVYAHPLYEVRDVSSQLLIVISSDRGLAGAYNTNILKTTLARIDSATQQKINTEVIVIGKQAARTLSKVQGIEIVGLYEDVPDVLNTEDLSAIVSKATQGFEKKQYDVVDIIYTDFKSSISQVVESTSLLPASFEPARTRDDLDIQAFEPSPGDVISTLTPRLLEVQMMQFFLEARASEHSMRMLSMKNASDNAEDIIDELTLTFNRVRQAGITQEIAEISAGAESIK